MDESTGTPAAHVLVGGEPGSTVLATIAGATAAQTTIGGDGTGLLVITDHVWDPISIFYVAGDQRGPATTLRFFR